jgi:hypothetical protein
MKIIIFLLLLLLPLTGQAATLTSRHFRHRNRFHRSGSEIGWYYQV